MNPSGLLRRPTLYSALYCNPEVFNLGLKHYTGLKTQGRPRVNIHFKKVELQKN